MDIRPTRQVIEAAAHWAATLDSDDATDADWAACERWCAEHPAHQEAWNRLRAFMGDPGTADRIEQQALRRVMARRRGRRQRLVGAGMAVLALVGVGVAMRNSDAWREFFPDYRSRTGEQRQIALNDGSRLTLDTNGAVNVRMEDDARRVELVRGQILADVAKAPGRPFVVETLDGTATALGTSFVVRRDNGAGTLVTVIHSHVRACPAERPDDCRILGPGEQIRLLPARAGVVAHVEPGRAAIWASGWLEVDDQAVADLLVELNRYRARPVRYDARALAGLRVSGSYPLGDTDRALDGIAAAAGLSLNRTPDGVVTLQRRP